MKFNLINILLCALFLNACANERPHAYINANNNGVSGSIGQTFRW